MNKLIATGMGLAAAIGVAASAFAADKTVSGTLEDSYCYGSMGAKGASHKECAIKCATAGIPVSLVEKGSSKIFVLLPPKNGMAMPKDVIDKMEDEVTVTGKEYSKGGVHFLTVESIK
jgi:hypothetical protein